VGPNFPTPLTYQYNLQAQYEFLHDWVLEVGYVGSRGIHLYPQGGVTERELNQALLASPTNPVNGITTNTVANASVRVPYLGFSPGGLAADETYTQSHFNSLQATVRKRMSHGLQIQAAYTYSSSISTSSYITYNDATQQYYGANPYYRPQRLAVNYSWDLPFGSRDGFVGKFVNGWNLAGVTIAQVGTPLTITDTRGGSVYGYGPGAVQTSTAEFASGMGNANVGTPGGVEQRLGGAAGGPGYFNKAAFLSTGPPVIGSDGKATGYGNAGLGVISGPGQFNWDATIQKTTRVGGIHEGATLVFRTDFFNLFNHAQFNAPTTVDVSKSTFGQITSTVVNPRLVQFGLKYVF
jgi:hypothetical protein